jgi:hypothetical protein
LHGERQGKCAADGKGHELFIHGLSSNTIKWARNRTPATGTFSGLARS